MLNDIINKIYKNTDILLVQSESFKKIIDSKLSENKSIYFPSWPETLGKPKNFKIKKKNTKLILFLLEILEKLKILKMFLK